MSNASLVGRLLEAMTGGSSGVVASQVFEVEAWPDGLVVSGSTDGDRWVPWDGVERIGPPDSPVVGGVMAWVEVTLKDGPPVRLGRGHLLAAGDEAAVETEVKIEQLRAAWQAWWSGVWPPT